MSRCDGLNMYTAYPLAWVKHDETNSAYITKIINPPRGCEEGVFVTHKGELIVNHNVESAQLTYTTHPVITVRDESLVQVINPQSNYLLITFYIVLVLMAWWLVYKFFSRQRELSLTRSNSYNPPSCGESSCCTPHMTPSGGGGQGGGTTIINNGGHNDGFFTGMLVGNLMSGSHSHTERIVEKETIIERDHDSNHDDTYSSDDSNSSSYSSDSSSDYSGDSGSSFGGDSGGSFGSD